MNVLSPNYGNQVLLNVPTTYSGGMATPDADPRGGVFGPQGYGGGIFDSSNQGMSGLGQLTDDPADYPWSEFSVKTQELQAAANAEISARELDFCPLATDGFLGPATCGTLAAGTPWLPSPPQNCLEYGEPPAPPNCPTTTLRVSPPGPGNGEQERIMPKKSGMATWGWLLLAAGVAGAGIYMATRK